MDKKDMSIVGLYLALNGELSEDAPLNAKTKQEIVIAREVSLRIMVGAVIKDKETERLYGIVKRFNEEIKALYPEELAELESIFEEKEEKEKKENE